MMDMTETRHDEIQCKIVYFGPASSGRGANLRTICDRIDASQRGELVEERLEEGGLLTLELRPNGLPEAKGRPLNLVLAAITGNVKDSDTLQRLIADAEGMVYVADSHVGKMGDNLQTLLRIDKLMRQAGINPSRLPTVIQFNKRDLRFTYGLEEMNAKMNPTGLPCFAAVATTGFGVFATLRVIIEIAVAKAGEGAEARRSDFFGGGGEAGPVREIVMGAGSEGSGTDTAGDGSGEPEAEQERRGFLAGLFGRKRKH